MNPQIWQRHARINRLQSLLLLGALAGLLALIGWLLWGTAGLLMPVLAAVALLLLNPVVAPELVMRMYRARYLAPERAPALYAMLAELARRAGLPARPALYYVPSAMVNAFAVGTRGRAAIALTDGLLRTLDSRETLGVLAHEVSHVASNDLRVMALADTVSRFTSTLSLFGQLLVLLNLPLALVYGQGIHWGAVLLLVFAPNVAALAQLGLSRTREYDADLNAVRLTGDPVGLARALTRIAQVQGSFLERVLLPGRHVPEPSLLRTHPATEDRVRRLMELRVPAVGGPLQIPPTLRPVSEHMLQPRVARRPRWHVSGLWH